MSAQLRVLVWNENIHERENAIVREIYPKGMHECIADGLREDVDLSVRTATLHDPGHGLSKDALENTDVLVWWGHAAHGQVDNEAVERVLNVVQAWMKEPRCDQAPGEMPAGVIAPEGVIATPEPARAYVN